MDLSKQYPKPQAKGLPSLFRSRPKQSDPYEAADAYPEIPRELWRRKLSFGKAFRNLFNGFLLLLLSLALLGLIAAFAYQLTYHPMILAEWCYRMVAGVQGFLQGINGA